MTDPLDSLTALLAEPGQPETLYRALDRACHDLVGHRLFTLLYAAEPKHKVRAITNQKFFLANLSNTFHGRDVFAPSAAHLASGKVKPAQFGPLIKDYTQATAIFATRTGKRVWTGQVLKVDHFGNLITNLRSSEFTVGRAKHFELLVGSHIVSRFASNYQEAGFGVAETEIHHQQREQRW